MGKRNAVWVRVLLLDTLCPFKVCNHLACKEKANCFISLSSGCHVAIIGRCLFLTVPWVGPLCMIVALSGHTLQYKFMQSSK